MKKKVYFLVLVLSIISLFFVVKLNIGAKTIEEVIPKVGSKPVNIMHEEKTDKGIIVFYNHLGENDLSTAIVKKSLGGYKTVYSGVQGNIKLVLSKFGISDHYYPAIENTSPPVFFGIIGNPDIRQVKIIEKKRNIEGQAKIINAKDTRIWLIYMNDFEGSDFEIIGLSEDGKVLTKRGNNILPYSVEQKPFKSPYR